MRIAGMVLAAGIMIFISACTPTNNESTPTASPDTEPGTETTATYHTMSIDELANIVSDDDQAYTIVNVHIPYQGEIEGTDANIAFNDIEALTEALPDKNAPIVLYCSSGNMSEQAAQDLVKLGYTQVYDVPGGMYAWQSSGRSLVNSQ
ncbi:rhodanese-like domain-containing protein [Phototrophicus methaneseepsis]|uniref:Rhodanese-like domain-containing protein n=1 Tax=Phototrophicus methaneseepsis TaxID=2710758 RepID=A0A7S8E5P3_9CHLR|nr:rhodanese-like domain-containing protein [Phototrophicus methaneseepsis]QPC80842.1 rhodanese-like domain-containing protein [Phototrophicus methaneseepsis]